MEIERFCDVCGKGLVGKQRHYCSTRCKRLSHKSLGGTAYCVICGESFLTHGRLSQKTCSTTCAGLYRSRALDIEKVDREYRQRSKDHYAKYKQAYIDRNNKQYAEGKAFINEEKVRRGGCCVCGELEPVVLDLHHLDPKQKENNLAQMIRYRKERILDEMAKGVIICSNCHKKHHAGLLEIPSDADRGQVVS